MPQNAIPLHTTTTLRSKVIGNQDEDRKGIEGRRNSVDVDQVAPVAGPPEDEVEDEFEEEDFEDP